MQFHRKPQPHPIAGRSTPSIHNRLNHSPSHGRNHLSHCSHLIPLSRAGRKPNPNSPRRGRSHLSHSGLNQPSRHHRRVGNQPNRLPRVGNHPSRSKNGNSCPPFLLPERRCGEAARLPAMLRDGPRTLLLSFSYATITRVETGSSNDPGKNQKIRNTLDATNNHHLLLSRVVASRHIDS